MTDSDIDSNHENDDSSESENDMWNHDAENDDSCDSEQGMWNHDADASDEDASEGISEDAQSARPNDAGAADEDMSLLMSL